MKFRFYIYENGETMLIMNFKKALSTSGTKIKNLKKSQ